ncbi:hypothetical protein [Pseudomonas sp. CGJS7]|uniref:hypothetical protein n=1 Tax=Pseudomonas sp. CGJS7 TaxID=3109348 RepID=UPI003009841F
MTDPLVVQGLLEIHRTQILMAKLSESTAHRVPDSYAFAIDRRLCPVFQGDSDPFDLGYRIGRDLANSVVSYCDEQWTSGRRISFYDLESHFGRLLRWELISILRYAALDRRFDHDFFSSLASSCPSEAHGLNDSFSLDEIGLV